MLLIRHGPTEWNVNGRIQGHTDVSLGECGRIEVARWSIPQEFRTYDWLASPLARAMETALMLGASNVRPEPRLMEMNWGEWEGRTWEELHAAQDAHVAELETCGLDFRPPAGESRRQLLRRLQTWLTDVAARARPVAAVTHRGVIHAALALATGWDMSGKPPHRLNWSHAHLFSLQGRGELMVNRLNVGLTSQ
ncbi:MAG: histidine phosphatase family protein [Acidiferrobacterales bacterium]